jgi:hypothetical protein
MSTAKRKGIIFAANQIGNAKKALRNLMGNTFSGKTIRLVFENNFIKVRGSSIFHDYDLNKKSAFGNTNSDFNTFNTLDISDFVMQGGSVAVNKRLSGFGVSSIWNPDIVSPPSLEGWNIYDYNAFSNYIPKYNSSGLANTNYIIYNTLGEPGTGVSRINYSFPIRYTGTTYSRVPLFNFARWISVLNVSGSYPTECRIVIPKKYLDGSENINPYTNTPIDLAIYSHRRLITSSLSDSTINSSMGVVGVSDTLVKLAFEISESDINGNISRTRDHYLIKIILPSGITWDPNLFFHFVIYWGTRDTFYLNSYPVYIPGTSLSFYPNSLNTNWYIFATKSFFNKNITSGIGFSKTGVNDTNVYLYNTNHTNHIYRESIYNEVKNPFRYKVNDNIVGSTGSTGTILGTKLLSFEDYIGIRIISKNSGVYFDEPNIDFEVIVGEPFPYNEVPDSWENFTYYPEVPEGYNLIANVIAQYPGNGNSFSKDYILYDGLEDDRSIIYIELLSDNSLISPQSDENITKYFIDTFIRLSTKLRQNEYNRLFNNLARRIISRFSRYDISKIKNEGHFNSFGSLEKISLHNLLKSPKDNLLISDSEPFAIQFNNDASEVINSFAGDIPSTVIAGFNGTSLYNNKTLLSSDSNFEVYLEKVNSTDLDTLTESLNGLDKDYTFRIKFKNSKNEYFFKDLFLNASSYFLTDSDYQYRVDNNLSTVGYYKSSTLNDISDFAIYGYSAVIPDLKPERFSDIDFKQNMPMNSLRITEDEFESNLLSQNPSITKDEIISAKSGFAITDSFYAVDTSKPNNLFETIAELGFSVANYSLNQNYYWINNTEHLYGNNLLDKINPVTDIRSTRSDSFIIGKSGFYLTDNSVNYIENIRDQGIFASTGSSINQSSFNSLQLISDNYIAVRIHCEQNQEIKSFRVKLRNTSDYINQNAKIKAYLYSDKNNLPDEVLCTGSSVFTKNITNLTDDYYFDLYYKFFKNKNYWLVLYTDTLPPEYDPHTNGLANISSNNVSGIYDKNTNTYADFSRYKINAEFGIGSTNGSNINTWYPIVAIGSSTTMVVSGSGVTANKQNYSVRYKYELGIKEYSAIGASTNLAIKTSTGWTSYEGTAFVEFFQPDIELYGSFNRDFSSSNLTLPPPNKYREQSNYKVDGYWNFNCNTVNDDLYIYPRSLFFKKENIISTGVGSSNIISIGATNYSNKLLIGLGVSADSNISAGTSITNIVYSTSDDKYNVHLSSNLLGSFNNSIVGFGTNYSSYIGRANDIYVNINYYKNGGLATTTFLLEESPTWITNWYKRAKYNYNFLDKNISSDSITATYNLDFNNYNIDSQYSYLNGYAMGDFFAKSSIGTSIDFKFISSYGVRVFVNNASTPTIDNWKSSSATGVTFYHNLSSPGERVSLEVQFNNFKNLAGTGQTLIGLWKIRGTTTWQNIDESFYQVPSNEPILIDTNIERLSLVYVGKTLSEINDANFGSSPGDRIVLRSK